MIRYNPTPIGLTLWWNLASLLYFMLTIQTLSGFILVQYYSSVDNSFFYTQILIIEPIKAFFIRLIHINCVNIVFLVLYFHVLKAIFLRGWKTKPVWYSGVILLLLIIIVSFFGYTLPYRRMRFWAVTVIFNLLSVLPYGIDLVYWLWAGFYVNSYTIAFIFSLHFIFPFIILTLGILHLIYLHKSGSSRILATITSQDKIYFYPLFVVQDLINFLIIWIFVWWLITFPFLLIDVEIFVPINIISRPIHIQPEWYFLPYYSILRVIPNKVGGVLCFVVRILIFLIFPQFKFLELHLSKIKILTTNRFIFTFIILVWIAMNPVETPFVLIGQIFRALYFILLLLF